MIAYHLLILLGLAWSLVWLAVAVASLLLGGSDPAWALVPAAVFQACAALWFALQLRRAAASLERVALVADCRRAELAMQAACTVAYDRAWSGCPRTSAGLDVAEAAVARANAAQRRLEAAL